MRVPIGRFAEQYVAIILTYWRYDSEVLNLETDEWYPIRIYKPQPELSSGITSYNAVGVMLCSEDSSKLEIMSMMIMVCKINFTCGKYI